ncbi:crotonase/enoyl-CoA hydratase family protein [Nocardia bovistercoris]|uniref:Crotonase/enoyl-CoA hydratase family protein n=1 Tax=Nocardia bovistercoris TaxID=2785916 RepID=A0A931N4R5_9NOCA|nr:crotonase/enoyl-CoA hydratase family protein [Nocardia bovistercoris]MBH0777893.1 crotonase/enoyl-CoA hydratase family protein [Nocardia bovistercoris]
MSRTVTVTKHSGVTVVTIDRSDRKNAVDLPTATALIEAFERFDRDDSSRVAILTGAGAAFCAGADLMAIAEGERKPLEEEGTFAPMGPVRLSLSKPVIAAIEGPAVAGGLELAAWCDLRVAGRSAYFGMFNRRFGVPSCDLASVRLPRLIGYGRAMDLMLTGRTVTAPEALAIGLLTRVVDDGAALATASEIAAELASVPQTAMRNDRRALVDAVDLDEKAAIANEIRLARATLESGELEYGAMEFARGAGRNGRRVSGSLR